MFSLTLPETLTLDEADELIENMHDLSLIYDFVDEPMVELFQEIDACLNHEDGIVSLKTYAVIKTAHETFKEAFFNAFENAADHCLELQGKLIRKVKSLDTLALQIEPTLAVLKREEIVDPFEYRNYLQQQYNRYMQLKALVSIKDYTKKPKLSIVKAGVH